MSIRAMFQSSAAKGSAMVKLAEAETQHLEAKGRIVAIDAANKAKAEAVDLLKTEVNRVHADADRIKDDLNGILAQL